MRCKPLDFGVGNSPELIWTGGVCVCERERARPLGRAGFRRSCLILITIYDIFFFFFWFELLSVI
jgi:hypothetical protein